MPITLTLEPDTIPLGNPTTECSIALVRGLTGEGLPAVYVTTEQSDEVICLTLREFLAAARGLRARAEMWPEWQKADTP